MRQSPLFDKLRLDCFYPVVRILFLALIGLGCQAEHSMSLEPEPTSPPNTIDSNREEVTISFVEIYDGILDKKCAFCHQGNNSPKGLNMETIELAYTNLVSVPSVNKPEVLLIRPGDSAPDMSYLVAKIIESDEFRKSPRMPLTGGPLTLPQIEQIQLWIDEGASFH